LKSELVYSVVLPPLKLRTAALGSDPNPPNSVGAFLMPVGLGPGLRSVPSHLSLVVATYTSGYLGFLGLR